MFCLNFDTNGDWLKYFTSEATPLASSKDLTNLAILPDYRHPAILCLALRPSIKLGMILVNKVVLNLKFTKNHLVKNVLLNF